MNAPEQQDALLIDDDSSIAQRMVCRVSSVAIKAVFPFIAVDDVRYYLCGVNIRPLDDGAAMIIATDGARFVIIRDPKGYAETEVVAHVCKDAIKHADNTTTFDVMNNGSVIWNDAVGTPVFVQPGKSVIDGDFPRIESVRHDWLPRGDQGRGQHELSGRRAEDQDWQQGAGAAVLFTRRRFAPVVHDLGRGRRRNHRRDYEDARVQRPAGLDPQGQRLFADV